MPHLACLTQSWYRWSDFLGVIHKSGPPAHALKHSDVTEILQYRKMFESQMMGKKPYKQLHTEDTVLFCPVLFCSLLYPIILCCSVLYYSVLYCTIPCCFILYYSVLYCTLLCCIILYYTSILFCTVLHCSVLPCTKLNCSVLRCTILYCTARHYSVLYCTVFCWLDIWAENQIINLL